MIIQQGPRQLAQLLSTIIFAIGMAVVVLAVLFSDVIPFMDGGISAEAVYDEPISVPSGDAQSARITLDLGSTATQVEAARETTDLLSGSISYVGALKLDVDEQDDRRLIDMSVNSSGNWMSSATRPSFDPWQLYVEDELPLDLRIDAGSGAVDLDLTGVNLENFDLDAGSGRVSAEFPAPTFDANIDLGSGASTFTIPSGGNGVLEIDAGSGAVALSIAPGVQARIVLDDGSGRFNIDDRFQTVGDSDVWQTTGYEQAEERLLIEIDQGSGSVSVQPLGGR